jgi:hypothetical protein
MVIIDTEAKAIIAPFEGSNKKIRNEENKSCVCRMSVLKKEPNTLCPLKRKMQKRVFFSLIKAPSPRPQLYVC